MTSKGIAAAVVFGLSLLPMVPAKAADTQGSAASMDAVITYRRPDPNTGRPPEEVWYKHGKHVRIDTRSKRAPDLRFYQFTTPGQQTRFAIALTKNGAWHHLSLMMDSLSALPALDARTFSGATERHLGETCRVWKAVHEPRPGIEFVQSGCVTEKGIELWWRQANIDKIVATHIAYRPIAEAEVQPPLETLSVQAWQPMTPGPDHKKDYEVDLRSPDGDRVLRTRSGDWELTTTTSKSGQTSDLRNLETGLNYTYSNYQPLDTRLSIERRALVAPPLPPGFRERVLLGDDQILGIRCEWWNVEPNVTEGQRTECITADGIVLAISQVGGTFMRPPLTAVSATRARQPLDRIAPPHPGRACRASLDLSRKRERGLNFYL